MQILNMVKIKNDIAILLKQSKIDYFKLFIIT